MRVSGTKQRQIQGGMVGRKQRSPLSPRRPSHVSVAADLPPDLSSNAFDALRAARADDRLYVPLCLNRLGRVINTHGDILVSNAKDTGCAPVTFGHKNETTGMTMRAL